MRVLYPMTAQVRNPRARKLYVSTPEPQTASPQWPQSAKILAEPEAKVADEDVSSACACD